jgi:cell division protein FtsB
MKRFFESKFATGILAIALIAILFVTARLLTQKIRIDKQIKQLQARADAIRGQNQELSDLITYLNTDQYKEKAAREQLNLKKDGEVVVALPGNDSEQVASAQTTQVEQISNPKKWYNYFFQHEQ